MSRGPGRMQRLILDALAQRHGGDWCGRYGWHEFRLADGVHDMRLVSRELAREHNGISHCDFISGRWEASFSRAVRRLAECQLIEAPSLVPLAEDKTGRAERLSDGIYLVYSNDRQRRFARLLAQTATFHNT